MSRYQHDGAEQLGLESPAEVRKLLKRKVAEHPQEVCNLPRRIRGLNDVARPQGFIFRAYAVLAGSSPSALKEKCLFHPPVAHSKHLAMEIDRGVTIVSPEF